MQDIYSGAHVTIVALSGKSANSGIPRLHGQADIFPQLSCTIDGKRLVGLMPTLSQQIWRAPWGKRAWTLQEGLLSPRCVYISDHQLYFECNGMQACESLDDTRSWAHHLRLSSNVPSQGGWLASKVGDGCLRVPIDNPSHRMDRYGSKLTLYSYRTMTHAADGLNAFSGILKFLQTMYPKGFRFGLPIEDFGWSLVWRSQYPPTRRPGFPAWSWAGWEGGLWATYPFDITKPNEYPLHIRIWEVVDGKLAELFATSHFELYNNDCLAKAASSETIGPAFDLGRHRTAEMDGYLFVEAVMLRFSPDYGRPLEYKPKQGSYAMFFFSLGGVNCLLRIMSTDPEIGNHDGASKQDFILLARDCTQDLMVHYMLLVDIQENVAVRKTVLELIVPSGVDLLRKCRPVKRRIVLA
jgi:hypothetical protein